MTRDRAYVLLIGILVACTVTLGILTTINFSSNHSLAATALNRAKRALARAQQTTLVDAQVAGCQRLNIKQREDNRNQRADYLYERVFLLLIQHPTGPKQTPAQAAATAQFVGPLQQAVRVKAWVPIVANCAVVIHKHGSHYSIPEAVPFVQRMPPKSDL